MAMADSGQKDGPSSGDAEYHNQIAGIQQIFSQFDHEGTGKVRIERVPDLIAFLGRDLQLGREVSRQLLSASGGDSGADLVSFEEVVQRLKKVEELAPAEQSTETTTPLTLLKRLHAYRKKCEANGEYVEAQKARRKYEELRAKEEERQRRLVDQAQRHEMNEWNRRKSNSSWASLPLGTSTWPTTSRLPT
jgi:hypothetical protein